MKKGTVSENLKMKWTANSSYNNNHTVKTNNFERLIEATTSHRSRGPWRYLFGLTMNICYKGLGEIGLLGFGGFFCFQGMKYIEREKNKFLLT